MMDAVRDGGPCADEATEPNTLYRFYDRNDQLLYIGITVDLLARWKGHSKEKAWFREVVRATLTHYESRQEVLEAEAVAIKTERPLINIQHNNDLPIDADRLRRLGAPPLRSLRYTVEDLEQQLQRGKWLTTGAAAKVLGVDRFKVDKLLKARQIRYRIIPGAPKRPHRLCHPEDVLRLLEDFRKAGVAPLIPPS